MYFAEFLQTPAIFVHFLMLFKLVWFFLFVYLSTRIAGVLAGKSLIYPQCTLYFAIFINLNKAHGHISQNRLGHQERRQGETASFAVHHPLLQVLS